MKSTTTSTSRMIVKKEWSEEDDIPDRMEGRWCRGWSCGNIDGHPGRDASLYQINQSDI